MKTIVDYAQLVKQQHALNISLAPVEADPTASSKAYAIGQHFILDGELYKAKTAIALGDALVLDTNYEAAGSIEAQIETLDAENQTLTNQVSDISDEIADMNNVLGAKNILINTANTLSSNGITFTVNKDKSITVDGTATADTTLVVSDWRKADNTKNRVPIGLYEFSCKNMPENNGFQCIVDTANATGAYVRRIGYIAADQLTTINIDYSDYVHFYVFLYVTSGTTVNNVTVYPMLRPASIEDGSYVPYSMTNREMTPYVQAISNPNLLDNPWFTVNQRGITSWSNESGGYSADRWKHDGSATGSITNGVYTCNVPTYQNWEDDRITPLLGKTVTLSWMLSDGSIGFETKTLPSVLTSTFVWPFTNSYVVLALKSGNVSQVARINANVAVKAVKLELGTVSTLAMDTAPNYSLELLKCQRYFVRYLMPDNSGAPLGIGFYSSTTNARLSLTLPIEMRAKPSVNISDISKFKVIVDNVAKVISAVTVSGVFQNIITFNITTDTATQYAIATLNRTTQGEYIDLSADL